LQLFHGFSLRSRDQRDHLRVSCRSGSQTGCQRFPRPASQPQWGGHPKSGHPHQESRRIKDYLDEIKTAKTSYYIDDQGQLHDRDSADLSEPITRSALIIPLLFGESVSGVLQVMSYREDAYTENDLHLLERIGSQLAIVRNNIRLYQQTQKELELRESAENELQTFNAQLEQNVLERTAELNQRVEMVEKLNLGISNMLQDLNIANKLAEKTSDELSETNAELEAFVYSVSHDLRAPLRHIERFTEMLQQRIQDRLNESEERYLANIITATNKMRTLIEDMLRLSRASRQELSFTQLDLNQIIETVREDLADMCTGRNIEWKIGTLPAVQADAGLMKVVFTNLISNAVKIYSSRRKTCHRSQLPVPRRS
jgi:signal transduction histidine kinase